MVVFFFFLIFFRIPSALTNQQFLALIFSNTEYYCHQILSMVNLQIHMTQTGYQVAPLAVKQLY